MTIYMQQFNPVTTMFSEAKSSSWFADFKSKQSPQFPIPNDIQLITTSLYIKHGAMRLFLFYNKNTMARAWMTIPP